VVRAVVRYGASERLLRETVRGVTRIIQHSPLVLGQLDEHTPRRARMEKRYTFPLRADAGRLVDEPDTRGPAPVQRAVEVVDGEANVVDAWPSLRDKLPDRGVAALGLEQLDERLAGGESHDPRSIRILQRRLGHPEDIAVEGHQLREPSDGNADVCDAGSAAYIFHTLRL
jgi:hypothetical protein